MTKLGSRLIRSAEQALAIVRGEADPSTYKVFVPPDVDVAAIRRRLGLTQTAFAQQFGLPISTLRDWEQKRSRPDTPTRTLLKVIDRRPDVVREVLQDDASRLTALQPLQPVRSRRAKQPRATT